MTFIEHLEELRSRLISSLIPVIPMFVVAWIFREDIFSFLVIPLNKAWMTMGMGKPKLHFSSPVDPIVVYMKQSAGVRRMPVGFCSAMLKAPMGTSSQCGD